MLREPVVDALDILRSGIEVRFNLLLNKCREQLSPDIECILLVIHRSNYEDGDQISTMVDYFPVKVGVGETMSLERQLLGFESGYTREQLIKFYDLFSEEPPTMFLPNDVLAWVYSGPNVNLLFYTDKICSGHYEARD